MESIEAINNELISFLTKKIPQKYEAGNSHYFDEGDIVCDVHLFLNQLGLSPKIKVFREYPVHMKAPLRLTQKAFDGLITKYQDLNVHYQKTTSGYYKLITAYDDLIKNNPFQDFAPVDNGKYLRVYEPKYFDLVVLDEYSCEIPDEIIVPRIVMEFKYEASKRRCGFDLRKNLTLPKNSQETIIHDLDALDLYCRSNPGTIGYFVFLDEENGKNSKKFIPNLHANEQIRISGSNSAVIAMRTFKF